MKELLETLDTWTGGRGRRRPGRRRPDVRVRAAARGRRAAVRRRRPDRRARSAAAASRAPRPRRSTAPGRPGTPGSSATASATSRRGTSGLACGGTIDVLVEPAMPAVVVDAARGSLGAGGHGSAVITPLPADSPPGAFGPHEPGDGAPPAPELVVPRRRPARRARSASAELDAALVDAAARGAPSAACRGPSSSAGASLFIEVFPVRPRLVVVGAVEVARSLVRLARELGFETVVIDGRADVRDAGALPRRRPPRRRLAGRGRRRDRPRAERRGRGPDPRRQVRRAGHRRGAAPRLPLRRRGRIEARPRPTGAPGCSRRASADELARLRGPVGLDLGGRAPAETALAILAEIVAERYGGTGVADARAARSPDRRAGTSAVVGHRPRGRGGVAVRGRQAARAARRPAGPPARPRPARRRRGGGGRRRPRRRRGGHRGRDRLAVPSAASRNPDPARGLSSSLRVGFEALGDGRRRGAHRARRPAAGAGRGDPGAADAPAPTTAARSSCPSTPTIAAGTRSCSGGRPSALVAEATGDRGLGPVIAAHPELVREVAVDGANPDVDTPDGPGRAARGGLGRARRGEPRAGRPVPRGPRRRRLLRAGQRRCSAPTRRAPASPPSTSCSRLVEPGDTWLDIGAGAGRYRAPDRARARAERRVGHRARPVGRDARRAARARRPSTPSRTSGSSSSRWPPADVRRRSRADVSLIAHVGYDIEAIGPFLSGHGGARRAACASRC